MGRNGVLLLTLQGNITDTELPQLKQDLLDAAVFIRTESEKALRPLPILVDVSKLDRAYSPEGIMLLAEFEKNNRPYVSKTAVYGTDIKIKFTGEIISALSDRKNISFHETEEEAMAELRNDGVPEEGAAA
jgi:predicted transcriptional regulator YheO